MLSVLVGMVVTVGSAQNPQEEMGQGDLISQLFDAADKIVESVSGDSWAVIPALTYSPETSLGVGSRAIKVFRYRSDQQGLDTRPSTLPITFLYTLNRQLLFSTELSLWQPGNTGFLNARVEMADFPFKFYGIGSSPTKGEYYASRYVHFHLTYEREILKGLYMGPRFEIRRDDIYRTEALGLLENGTIAGSSGQFVSGMGGVVNFDTRDNIFQPTKGVFHQAQLMFFSPAFTSDFSFAHLVLDFRKYLSITPKQVLVGQAWASFTAGSVPFQHVSMIGGSDRMRGFFEGKYRDRHALVFQSEYRINVYRNLGVVLFGSVGQVGPDLEGFGVRSSKVGGGIGLRYKLNNEGLNLRFDLGFGDQTAYYFGLNEVM
jgi:outer membrane protein assembly factor BamA